MVLEGIALSADVTLQRTYTHMFIILLTTLLLTEHQFMKSTTQLNYISTNIQTPPSLPTPLSSSPYTIPSHIPPRGFLAWGKGKTCPIDSPAPY